MNQPLQASVSVPIVSSEPDRQQQSSGAARRLASPCATCNETGLIISSRDPVTGATVGGQCPHGCWERLNGRWQDRLQMWPLGHSIVDLRLDYDNRHRLRFGQT